GFGKVAGACPSQFGAEFRPRQREAARVAGLGGLGAGQPARQRLPRELDDPYRIARVRLGGGLWSRRVNRCGAAERERDRRGHETDRWHWIPLLAGVAPESAPPPGQGGGACAWTR